MAHLETAFAQLGFAIKLMQAAENGVLDLAAIDRPLTVADGSSILVLPDRVVESEGDLMLVCQNLVTITYGTAAITLDRCRKDAGVVLPDLIESDVDQWAALVYQVRNAFAHDMAEPKWHIPTARYRRQYRVGRLSVDLSRLHGLRFEYSHLGGPDGLFRLKEFGVDRVFGGGVV